MKKSIGSIGTIGSNNSKFKIQNSKSLKFTLVELVVSLGVFSILTLAMMRMFGAAQKMVSISGNRLEVYENAKVALNMITRDLQCVFYDTNNCWGTTPADYHSVEISTNGSIIQMYTNSPFNDSTDSQIQYAGSANSTLNSLKRDLAFTAGISGSEIIVSTVSDFECSAEWPGPDNLGVPNSVTVEFDVMALADSPRYNNISSSTIKKAMKKTFRKTIFIANRYLD